MSSTMIPGTPIELESQSSRSSIQSTPQPTSQFFPRTMLGEQVLDEGEAPSQQLEPADGGKAAWRLLCTAFIVEALLWGFPLSFGVFQNYYSHHAAFANNPFVPIIGTIATGLSYLGAPVINHLVKRYPKYQRHMVWIGFPICVLGLVAGSFATTIGALIVTQGIMYGLGNLLTYVPLMSMVNEYWVARRGMAFGLICSASGFSGAIMPFIIQALLHKYGYPTTLRSVAIALTVLIGPMMPLVKGRLPPAEQSALGKTDWSFLRRPLFWVFCTSNVLQGLGYFFPSLYLPSYATSIGLSAQQGALTVALMSVTQTIGQLTFGYLSDNRLPLWFLAILSTLVSALAVLALWGLSQSLTPLIIFALIYGFFGAGYVSIWARMGTAVSEEPTAAMAIYTLFCFGKGVGNVLAGPISGGLLMDVVVMGYGLGKYRAVVVFTGVCMILSAASIGAWYVRPKRMRLL